MKLARSGVIFAMGLFALAAQTLLFRQFLTAFEGNELGIGSFFGSWLLWVAAGAAAARLLVSRSERLVSRFELLTLTYLPAFLLQEQLIIHARQLGGISAYEIYPYGRMLFVSLVVNAPVSLLTGMLFTLACRWWAGQGGLPVARVYILETLGSFVGGVGVTLLLAGGTSGQAVFLWCAALLGLAAALSHLAGGTTSGTARLLPLAVPAGVMLLLACGLAGWWTRQNDRAVWRRLLPAEQYRGSFATAQARYLYGQREGQFVVMSWGGVCEALPNLQHASEVVALSLAQHPQARRVLVVGPGSLAICLRLRQLSQIRQVVWLHPDPQYPPALVRVLPESLRRRAEALVAPNAEIRSYIRRHAGRFDLILLNLPDATTLVLNRYWTREFYSLLRGALADDGVMCVRISGGANYLGGELIYLGCAALQTVKSVFRHVVLKPGDESWLIASAGRPLSDKPAELRDRFAAIKGAADIYPPDGLLSLYLPDRAQFQLDKYERAAAQADPAMLVNTDRRPKALLFSLLLALRRVYQLSFARQLPVLLVGGVWIAACPIVLYGLLRVLYLAGLVLQPGAARRRSGTAVGAVFDGQFLILSTGLAGMALSIVLMFFYQSHFGSLFLHIGLVSSLFMLGSCLGSLLSERLLAGRAPEPRWLLPVCVALHLVLIGVVSAAAGTGSAPLFAALFAACGVFVGVYFPLGAHRLRAAGRPAAAAGANLEMLDHMGGALGGVLTGWLLLPLLGGQWTLLLLALLAGVNLCPLLVPQRARRHAQAGDRFDRLVRPAGYTMLGVGLSMLLASHIVAAVQTGRQSRLLQTAAREMVGQAGLVRRQARLPDGSVLQYYTTDEPNDDGSRLLFSTAQLAKGIYGYGGPIVLAACIEADGTLRDLRILRSNETPAYIESLKGWLAELPGRNLFAPSPFDGVDAVSGATMSSDAILQTLEGAGRTFAAAVLGRQIPGGAETRSVSRRWQLDHRFVWLVLLTAAAVALRWWPGKWVRRVFLLIALIVAGLVLNLQYSSQQVMALLSGQLPGNWLGGSFFLVLAVPVVVLLAGNVYCGYMCPFGALQELAGELRPARWQTDPSKRLWRYGRAVKYVLLLLLVVLYSLTRRSEVLAADPLITVFSPMRSRTVVAMAVVIVALSLVFRRFWCRNLCPAGAFLALLCSLRPLRRLLPRTGPARCDLGVRTARELDCLCCDRCRQEPTQVQQ